MIRSDMINKTNSSSGHSSNSHGRQIKKVHIYDLTLSIRRQLCEHLDALNVWNQLAKQMSLRPDQVQSIQRQESLKQSPTDELLKIWGNYNHTVAELYVLLHRQRLFPAMRLIKDFVDPIVRSRWIIPDSKPDFSAIYIPTSAAAAGHGTKKMLNCGSSSGISNTDSLNTRDDNITTSSSSSMPSLPPTTSGESQESRLLNECKVREIAKSITEYKYEELVEATNNWHESNVLGKGGFGTVYKGVWQYTEIAIKRMDYRGRDSDANSAIQLKQSLNELKFLYACRHHNLLSLYGYCIRGEKPCLVYEYMKNGSLDSRLHTKKNAPLTFQERVEICLGTAIGINWIHTREKPLIHGDIKPANVLLDGCLQPKIGDFGLAREGPNAINIAIEVSEVYGTKFYLPPEFKKFKKLSTQVDTYSFGVTMLETFTGLLPYARNREIPLLTDYILHFFKQNFDITQLCDKNMPLSTQLELQTCRQLFQLGYECIDADPQKRPEINRVVEILAGVAFALRSMVNQREKLPTQ